MKNYGFVLLATTLSIQSLASNQVFKHTVRLCSDHFM